MLPLLALATLLLGLSSGRAWIPGQGVVDAPVGATSGDEPHYLLLVHSLLRDGDLDLGPDHAALAAGEDRAGARFVGVDLDHHTWVVDDARGERALWSELYDWRRPQRCEPGASDCVRWRKLDARLPESSATRVERPAHPPASALVTAALLWPWRDDAAAIERGAVSLSAVWIVATLLATAALAARLGLGGGGQAAAVALLLASPLLAYGHGVFSEPLAALSLTSAAWAWQRERPSLTGALAAFAAAIKPPWALLGLALLAWGWRSNALRRRFAVVWIGGGGLLVLANLWLVGGPVISGQLGWQWVASPMALPATWIDGRHGLLPFVPWAILALPSLLRGGALAVFGPGLAALAALLTVFGSLGEVCFGPRLWLPVLPLLAVAAVDAARAVRASWRPIWRRWLWLCAVWAGAAAAPGVLAWSAAWEQPAYALLRVALRRMLAG